MKFYLDLNGQADVKKMLDTLPKGVRISVLVRSINQTITNIKTEYKRKFKEAGVTSKPLNKGSLIKIQKATRRDIHGLISIRQGIQTKVSYKETEQIFKKNHGLEYKAGVRAKLHKNVKFKHAFYINVNGKRKVFERESKNLVEIKTPSDKAYAKSGAVVEQLNREYDSIWSRKLLKNMNANLKWAIERRQRNAKK